MANSQKLPLPTPADTMAAARTAIRRSQNNTADLRADYSLAAMCDQRLDDIGRLMILMPSIRHDPDLARIIFCEAYWRAQGDASNSKDRRREIAGADLLGLLPDLPQSEFLAIKSGPLNKRLTNRKIAERFGITWAKRQKFRLKQFGAYDLPEEQYQAALEKARADNDKAKKAKDRRAAGVPTREELSDARARRRDDWSNLAKEHGIAVRTVKDRVAKGILVGPPPIEAYLHSQFVTIEEDAAEPTVRANVSGEGALNAPSPSPSSFSIALDRRLRVVVDALNNRRRA